MDAVTAAVVAVEDDRLFNAGRGAVFTSDGSLMDAAEAGAVAGMMGARKPVLAARALMERSEHWSAGAIGFCRQHGVPLADYD
jgi:isoaspartyl peptidase/L-asparaginase-like protein (Ntn-hydrolase superfamily)